MKGTHSKQFFLATCLHFLFPKLNCQTDKTNEVEKSPAKNSVSAPAHVPTSQPSSSRRWPTCVWKRAAFLALDHEGNSLSSGRLRHLRCNAVGSRVFRRLRSSLLSRRFQGKDRTPHASCWLSLESRPPTFGGFLLHGVCCFLAVHVHEKLVCDVHWLANSHGALLQNAVQLLLRLLQCSKRCSSSSRCCLLRRIRCLRRFLKAL